MESKVFEHIINELSAEDIETLRALHTSSLWKKYREVLIRAKDAHFLAMLPEMDTNKTFQAKGMVAGINYCVNQLPVILAGDALKKKREMSRHQ
jgi:hypothetical protein